MTTPNIHAHPTRKIGLRPPSDAPVLRLAKYLTGVVPAHPPTVDYLGSTEFGLYGNDQFGDCGPTSVANARRLIRDRLAPSAAVPSQQDVFDLYRRSGNPHFDPATDADDNGVDMKVMLSATVKGGIGGTKALGFAAVDVHNLEQVRAAIALFGNLLLGVDLQVAQQTQTDNGAWDYAQSASWGGHAVLAGAYQPGGIDVISWAERVDASDAFSTHQLSEAYVVIWPEHLTNQAFLAGVDLAAFAADYQTITGRPFPGSPAPAPTPGAASFPGATAEVDRRVVHAAARQSLSTSQWLNAHLASYFKIPSGGG